MDTTSYILIGVLFLIMIVGLVGVLDVNGSKHKEQIKKMQNQIDELCKVTGHRELISTHLTDDEKINFKSKKEW